MPNYEHAAVAATETLIKYGVSSAPVIPLPILKSIQGILVLSFAELASQSGMDRSSFIGAFAAEAHDATTLVKHINGKTKYLVAYNQRLPFYLLQRALARELGHIIMGHDGSKKEDVRTAEAVCFAQHLLCPRPLIKSLEESCVTLTTEVVGNVTGCYERCLSKMRKIPCVHVPASMNRAVKKQFADYVTNFVDMQSAFKSEDDSSIADFGTYMEGYED